MSALQYIGADVRLVTNVLNRPNWQIGTQENRSDYLQHVNGEYRSAQVGFRLTF